MFGIGGGDGFAFVLQVSLSHSYTHTLFLSHAQSRTRERAAEKNLEHIFSYKRRINNLKHECEAVAPADAKHPLLPFGRVPDRAQAFVQLYLYISQFENDYFK